jgi:Ca2+-transporting ATPase
MTTVFEDGKQIYSFTKGAPDILIDRCTKFISKNGSVTKTNVEFLGKLK